jgi:acyl-CoA synthetase (AMP-forming)/AMP-acid ligase II
MNIARWIARAAESAPEHPAIAVGRRVHRTYRQFACDCAAIAGYLSHACRLAPGERVAVVMPNDPNYLVALCGAWHAGLIIVPINSKLHPKEVEFVLGHSGAELLITTSDLASEVGALPVKRVLIADSSEWRRAIKADSVEMVDRSIDDPAWIFYTSGTTGRPKGATLSFRSLIAQTLAYFADVARVTAENAVLHAAPMSHGSGLYGLPYLAKGALSILPESSRFDPEEVVVLLGHWTGVSFFAAPTMLNRVVAEAEQKGSCLPGLHSIIYGGAPMYLPDIKRALDICGPRFTQIYGQGEAPMTITALSLEAHADTLHPAWERRLASVGVPRTNVEVRVVNEEDHPVPAGATGEVVCKGDVLMTGYWRDEGASRQAIVDGWLHTGDIGAFDGDGFLTLKDRSKDLIISGGSNIYPREVEEVLVGHPGVSEVAVVGRPHPDWGEEVVAFVVVQPGLRVSEDELDAVCLANIGRFKRPKSYVFVDALPKNNYGKVLKTALRESARTSMALGSADIRHA